MTTRSPSHGRSALSLRRSISWTLVSRTLYAVCQWAALLVLARMGGPQAVGRFALALAVTGPIVLFSNLALRHLQATDAERSHGYGDYLAVRVATVIAAMLAIVVVAATAGYSRETAVVLVLVGVAKSFESLSDVVYGLEQAAHRLDLTARSLMIRGLAGAAALALAYSLTDRLTAAIGAMTAAWAATYLLLDLPAQQRLRAQVAAASASAATPDPTSPLRRRLRLVRLALPMGAVALLISLNINVPRYFIEARLGEEALGAFAAMAYFVVVGTIVVNGFGQAALVTLADHHARGRQRAFYGLIGRMVGVSLALGAAGVVVSGLFGRQLLALVYGPSFSEYAGLFVWVMLAGGLSYAASSLFYGVTARRIFKGQALLYAIVAGTNVGAAALLIDAHGMLGVIGAWLAALSVQIVLSAWLIAPGRAATNVRPAPGLAVTEGA